GGDRLRSGYTHRRRKVAVPSSAAGSTVTVTSRGRSWVVWRNAPPPPQVILWTGPGRRPGPRRRSVTPAIAVAEPAASPSPVAVLPRSARPPATSRRSVRVAATVGSPAAVSLL